MIKKNDPKQLLLVLPFILAACSSGQIVVNEPLRETYAAKTVTIERDTVTTEAPSEHQNLFEKALSERLLNGHNFAAGKDLTIRYRFLQCDEGDRFGRWFTGGIGNAGEGTLTVEATFYNRMGVEIGKVSTEGKVMRGIGGGSFGNAIKAAAQKLAKYIVENFK